METLSVHCVRLAARRWVALAIAFAWLFVPAGAGSQEVSAVRITELLAEGPSGLLDEDGEAGDWIELQNGGAVAVDLSGWSLTDERDRPRKWPFPAVNLPTGGFVVVFASGKDRADPGRELHANFKLAAEGEYLGLFDPSGRAVQEFAPAFPPQRKGFSYGVSLEGPPLVLVDAQSAVSVYVPADGSLGLDWTGDPALEPFDDSEAAGWIRGAGGVGYDAGGGGPQPLGFWAFDDAGDTDAAIDSSGRENHGVVTSHFALSGGGGRGKPAYTAAGEGRSGGAADRALDFGATGSGALVHVPTAADGAFDSAVAADAIAISLWARGGPEQPANCVIFWGSSAPDGTGVRSLNAHIPWSDAVIYWDTAGCCDGTQRISKAEPDPARWRGVWNHYAFVKDGDSKRIYQNGALFHEGTNVADLTAIRGLFIGGPLNQGDWSYGGRIDEFALWDRPLGPQEIEALARGASPLDLSGLGSLVGLDLSGTMRGKSSSAYVRIPFDVPDGSALDALILSVLYDDGFAAFLNGVEVARRNAPAVLSFDARAISDRPREKTIKAEEIDLSARAGLLKPGRNILAFHGLNDSPASPDFLLRAELRAGRWAAERYLELPTPGAANGAGRLGFVADTTFSADRGLYDAPFSLEIACATEGAAIHLTLDGREPGPGKPGSRLYAAPISITGTTTLRAAAFKDGFFPSDVDCQTYIFPAQVKRQPALPAGLPAAWSGGYPADYGVDPDVVDSTLPGYSFEESLASIPTVSIVMPREDLFGSGSGLYYHSQTVQEKPASIEWIDPRGRRGFQSNAGVRIHGYTSRDHNFTPKHSFRVHFRERYGAAKLQFPLFPDTDVDRFDQFHLRGMSTDSWPVMDGWPGPGPEPARWYREKAQNLRDRWMKDTQIAQGQDACHGVSVHVFLNGLYWGLYDLTERPTDSFQAEHFGGERQEYDVLKDFAEVQSGTGDAWGELMAQAAGGLATPAAYQRIQGNNPDGTPNPAFPSLLDADSLIDYMILHIYAGADDWPNHNWWAGRQRGAESAGFRFFAWDQEITNNSLGRTHTSWGTRFEDVSAYNSPAYLYAQLRANAEFRLRFADRVHRHLFEGALTPEANIERWMDRAREVDRAIVGESARWGDHRRAVPFKREVEWLEEQRWLTEEYFPEIHSVALGRFRRVGLYPAVSAPGFSPTGGPISTGEAVALSAPAGEVYFTLDGSDPRRSGGSVSPAAQRAQGPVSLEGTGRLKARALHQGTWSALAEAFFWVEIQLRIAEVMYHPAGPPAGSSYDAEDFEFIEMANIGAARIQLGGIRLSGGVEFNFSQSRIAALEPGEVVLVVRDLGGFASRYGTDGLRIAGEYGGELRNSGERLLLVGPRGEPIHDFRYRDHWHPETDGAGRSLEVRDILALSSSWAEGNSWRPSAAVHGSPGTIGGSGAGLQLRGDLNQDKRVDLGDAVGLLFALFLDPEVAPPCAGPIDAGGNLDILDGSGDGRVDVSDAVHLLVHLFLAGPPGRWGGACARIEGCPQGCGG